MARSLTTLLTFRRRGQRTYETSKILTSLLYLHPETTPFDTQAHLDERRDYEVMMMHEMHSIADSWFYEVPERAALRDV